MSLLAVKEKGWSLKCISNKPGFFFSEISANPQRKCLWKFKPFR